MPAAAVAQETIEGAEGQDVLGNGAGDDRLQDQPSDAERDRQLGIEQFRDHVAPDTTGGGAARRPAGEPLTEPDSEGAPRP